MEKINLFPLMSTKHSQHGTMNVHFIDPFCGDAESKLCMPGKEGFDVKGSIGLMECHQSVLTSESHNGPFELPLLVNSKI